MKLLSRLQLGRRELLMIGRIRKMLSLQAQRRAMPVHLSLFTLHCTVQEISGVKLHARLGRQDIHDPAAGRLIHFHCQRRPCRAGFFVQHPVVIVAFAKFELLVVRVDARADGRLFRKIERCSCHRLQLARRYQRRIHGSKSAGVNHYFMLQVVAVPLAR